jgi:uncharacterized protein YlzI (FlbEa/FlbD family)
MENKIELTAKQLSSLDLLILKKQENSESKVPLARFTGDVLFLITNFIATIDGVPRLVLGPQMQMINTDYYVVANAATAVAVGAMGGNTAANEKAIKEVFEEMARNAPLDGLIELRKMAILKK